MTQESQEHRLPAFMAAQKQAHRLENLFFVPGQAPATQCRLVILGSQGFKATLFFDSIGGSGDSEIQVSFLLSPQTEISPGMSLVLSPNGLDLNCHEGANVRLRDMPIPKDFLGELRKIVAQINFQGGIRTMTTDDWTSINKALNLCLKVTSGGSYVSK